MPDLATRLRRRIPYEDSVTIGLLEDAACAVERCELLRQAVVLACVLISDEDAALTQAELYGWVEKFGPLVNFDPAKDRGTYA